MMRRFTLIGLGLLVAGLVAGCRPVTAPAGSTVEPAATETATETATEEGAATPAAAEEGVGLANPASVFCEQQGGKLEIRDETGGQVGYCLFDDGSECEEWAYLRGECAPGESKEQGAVGLANPASVHCTEQGGTLEIRQDAGGEYGMCVFPDGSECEEWAYFRGQCAPGENMPAAGASGDASDTGAGDSSANMPNPASVNCTEQGGTLEIRQDAGGGEYGMCLFPDNTECEEWALLRGACAPGENPAAK